MKSEPFSNHLLVEAAQHHGDRIAVRDEHSEINYRHLLHHSRELGEAIVQRGVKPGSVVALDNLDPFELITSFWACSLFGLIAFPLNTRFPVDNLTTRLASMDIAVVLSRRDLLPGKSIDLIQLLADTALSETTQPVSIENNTPVSLLMTSGSSGSSKFVLHQYGNHVGSALASNQNILLTSTDAWLLSLPLYHVGGLSILFRAALEGACVVLPTAHKSLLLEIQSQGVTHLSLVSTQLQRLLTEIESSQTKPAVKSILLGGSAIPDTLIQKGLDLGLPLYLSYGSTEMATQITTTLRITESTAQPYSSGKPLAGVDLIIDHSGEILVSGPMLSPGYLEQGEIIDIRDDDGWFHTGDVGYLEVNGELTITGRMDNQFISGGENIQPEHIEMALVKHSGIISAVVVPNPDPEFGFRPVAFIQLSEQAVSANELTEYLRNSLPGYMIPTSFYLIPDELLNANLKLPRQQLKGLLADKNKQLHSL
jgi:O-succinylbenzoic acid--CoA ligase